MANTSRVTDILKYIAPFVIYAGDYAKAIQSNVKPQDAKLGESNPFGAALTDADLSVQNFIEVALLSKYPEITFLGEENDKSLNAKYFKNTDELCVFLDPVDGTRFYQDGLDNYNVVFSIANSKELLGALCYIPEKEVLFSAEKGKSATFLSSEETLEGLAGKELCLNKDSAVAITYDFPEITEKLSPELTVSDIAIEYSTEKSCLSISAMLLGRSSALIGRRTGIIDWGVMAFIAKQAGAIVSDLKGNPLPAVSELGEKYKYPTLLVAASKELHKRIAGKISPE